MDDELLMRGRRERRVIVNGPFRSGTNLTRYLVDNFSDYRAVFSWFWWKHMPAPAGAEFARILRDIPMIVAVRDPVEWAVSLHSFFQARRAELYGNMDLETFIASDCVVFDNTPAHTGHCPRYTFASPMAYYNFYYLSYLNSPLANVIRFVCLHDLVHSPRKALLSVLPRTAVVGEVVQVPQELVLPSIDDAPQELATTSPPDRDAGPLADRIRSAIHSKVQSLGR